MSTLNIFSVYRKSHCGVHQAVRISVLYSYDDVVPSALSSANLTYEIVCLVLTLIKTVSIHRRPRGLSVGQHTHIGYLLLRDGESPRLHTVGL